MNSKLQKGLLVAIPLLIVAAAAFLMLNRDRGPVIVSPTTVPAAEFEAEQTRATRAPGEGPRIRIPGYTVIPVKANTTDVEIDLYNPEENEVYFQITFVRKDTGATLYESKLLQPGQHLYQITLNEPLAPGDYDITIRYATFAADESLAPRNGANVDCIIRAE